ncbi:signal peptidase II [Aeromicrobium halocynthiae]|uniref:Lipoprotein signal peptidase n=1 Tax=Aeromicrobium halocynthiae TaxID=560557 RepID=A0ABN2VS29_9ACTN
MAPERPSQVRRLAIGVVVAYAIDQLTKVWAVATLEGEPSRELVPGFLSLTFLRNPGAAFGMGASMTVILSVVSLAVVVVVVRMAARLRDPWWTVGLGLLLAGALGNLTDRILREPGVLRGHVVDFIDYGPFVGNVADIYLTVAAVVIVVRSWQGHALDGTRESR